MKFDKNYNIRSSLVRFITSKSSTMKTIIFVALILTLGICQDNTYTRYYDQCKKIVEGMTLEQKVGQTIQADFESITNREKQQTDPTLAVTWALGGLMVPGDSAPTEDGNIATLPNFIEVDKVRDAFLKKTSANWKKVVDRVKDLGVEITAKDKTKYKIKFFIANDAVHGDQHVLGNVIFPHNIGLSCSHNEQHFQNIGFWTQQSMKKTGFNYAYAPSVAVSHNPQWGRFYESLGQEDEWIEKYGQSFVKGLMDVNNGKINGVLGGAKSFFGDGATRFGANEGSANVINFKAYLKHNSPGYKGAITSGLGSVVLAYGGTNYVPSAYDSYLKLGFLRETLGFTGFTTTSYDELKREDNEFLPRTFFNVTEEEGYSMIVMGGTDMLMISGGKLVIERIMKHSQRAVERNFVLEKRLDESVVRILSVKMAMGLISKSNSNEDIQEEAAPQPQTSTPTPPSTSAGDQYLDSLNAVHESLVLLKNTNNILPIRNIKTGIENIILVGESIYNLNGLTKTQLYRNFDNIGMQCGGWTVRWQGYQGNEFWSGDNKQSSNASSLLDALTALKKSSKFNLIFPNYTTFTNEVTIENERIKFLDYLKANKKNFNSRNTLIIGSFGEYPYAETVGDVNIPYCKVSDVPECLYRPTHNPYAPGMQSRTLKLDFSSFERNVIEEVRSVDKNTPLVSVLFSGRPLLADSIVSESTAFIAAWLPGTSGGQGVIDTLTGDYIFKPNGNSDKRNTLSMDWPRTMETLSNFPLYGKDNEVPKILDVSYKVGYGLATGQSSFWSIFSQ